MGWFSDDDDDDEPTSATFTAAAHSPDDDEEEDPLDAFMNSLPTETAATNGNTGHVTKSRGERLDHDAEDEATIHWVKKPTLPASSDTKRLLPSNQDHKVQEEDTIMNNFVRAGDKRKYTQGHNHPDIQEDGEDDIHTKSEIILEKQHSNNVKLPPIQKIIHPPQNTLPSQQWRSEHSITCHPPMDPILSFDPTVFTLPLVKQIAKRGMENMTLVQAQTLGVSLAGRDGVVTAKTGSGKSEYYSLVVVCIGWNLFFLN